MVHRSAVVLVMLLGASSDAFVTHVRNCRCAVTRTMAKDPWEEMQRRGAREQAKGLNDPDDDPYRSGAGGANGLVGSRAAKFRRAGVDKSKGSPSPSPSPNRGRAASPSHSRVSTVVDSDAGSDSSESKAPLVAALAVLAAAGGYLLTQ